MRFGWLTALAAAILVAPAAKAATVIQDFSSSFALHASQGPGYVGGLNLAPNQFIKSAVIEYSAVTSWETVLPPEQQQGVSAPITAGIYIESIFSDSRSIVQSPSCSSIFCEWIYGFSDTYVVPGSLFPLFAGPTQLGVAPDSGAVPPGFLNQFGTGADGIITFEIGEAALPEPATWALMILGFGVLGSVIRRKDFLLSARSA
ncbi:PEPxxWA-CTERM sorting domain-containing protein [Sphingomonas sp. CL5.1]|uniref:PEPxxWA-CTERM sorting domain-containing protein n=1 Tax=Sphingomonas sp. CL5.1 TaxID=2653203 RepID=UPI0020C6C4BE|nr:PEPxxWA-CTERM sorting domain-containing protein [Sphingomonas sp. CL5.1]